MLGIYGRKDVTSLRKEKQVRSSSMAKQLKPQVEMKLSMEPSGRLLLSPSRGAASRKADGAAKNCWGPREEKGFGGSFGRLWRAGEVPAGGEGLPGAWL